jgi:hypothetical protein
MTDDQFKAIVREVRIVQIILAVMVVSMVGPSKSDHS